MFGPGDSIWLRTVKMRLISSSTRSASVIDQAATVSTFSDVPNESSESGGPSNSLPGWVIGVAVGGVLLVIAVAFLIFWLITRRWGSNSLSEDESSLIGMENAAGGDAAGNVNTVEASFEMAEPTQEGSSDEAETPGGFWYDLGFSLCGVIKHFFSLEKAILV
jgi:hypothetical protein